jgi:hypothetical protein
MSPHAQTSSPRELTPRSFDWIGAFDTFEMKLQEHARAVDRQLAESRR